MNMRKCDFNKVGLLLYMLVVQIRFQIIQQMRVSNKQCISNKSLIQNPSRHLMEIFAKIVNGFILFTIFAKSSILDVGLDSGYTSGKG